MRGTAERKSLGGNNARLVQCAVQYPAVPLIVVGIVVSTPECCNGWEIASDWRMNSRDHMSPITEHAKSEGVFTTAQATRLDTPPRCAARRCEVK